VRSNHEGAHVRHQRWADMLALILVSVFVILDVVCGAA
jgi:hypothetical protein